MTDSFDLQRFVDAQEGSYAAAQSELRAGRKRSHWMWFVFPQLRDLGRSATAKHFGIGSRAEAAAYLRHDVLGPRLRESAGLLTRLGGRSPELVMGSVDALKLRSSMTLFATVAEDLGDAEGRDVFRAVLDQYYGGEPDSETVRLLG